MKAIIKRLHSPDIYNLSDFVPEKADSFYILLQLIVSPLNIDGEESFDVILCTPKWLIENHQKSDIIIGRHHLIVFEYNYNRIYDKLKRIVENIEGHTWNDIAEQLSRLGKWEFEDYHK